MKSLLLLGFLLVIISISTGEHLILGDVSGRSLIYHEVVHYNAIPFMKRVKNFFYVSPEQRVIYSILAYDNIHSKATANVTAGGVGYTYVNLRLKSERGKGLDMILEFIQHREKTYIKYNPRH